MPTMAELFMGYGGLGLAVTDALGVDVDLKWCAEVDPAAVRVIQHRYPRLRNHGDVTKVNWARVGKVDILTGGSHPVRISQTLAGVPGSPRAPGQICGSRCGRPSPSSGHPWLCGRT